MASKSCCLGFLICLALLALLFGIDAMARDFRNKREAEETAQYEYNATCLVHSVSLRRGRSSSGGACVYAAYIVFFSSETIAYYTNSSSPGYYQLPEPVEPEDFDGLRQAFSNFYDRACDGVIRNVNTTEPLPCWFDHPREFNVRVSPVYERVLLYRVYGLILLIGGGLPLLVFVCYNCFLCCYVCCRSNDDDDETPRQRQQRLARLQRQRDEEFRRQNQVQPRRTEPFEIADIEDHEQEELNSRFTGNAYAKAVIDRLTSIKNWRKNRRERAEQRKAAELFKQQYGAENLGQNVEEMTAGQPSRSIGPTPMAGEGGGEVPQVEECQVCLEQMKEAVIIYPCGHVFCDECATKMLSDNYLGLTTVAKCAVCREEHNDEHILRLRLSDNTRTPAVTTARAMSAAPTPAYHERVVSYDGAEPFDTTTTTNAAAEGGISGPDIDGRLRLMGGPNSTATAARAPLLPEDDEAENQTVAITITGTGDDENPGASSEE